MSKSAVLFLTILTSGISPVFGNEIGKSIYKAKQDLKKTPATKELPICYDEALEEKVKTTIENIQGAMILESVFWSKKVDKQGDFFKDEFQKLVEEKAVWHQVMNSALSPSKPTTFFSTSFPLYNDGR